MAQEIHIDEVKILFFIFRSIVYVGKGKYHSHNITPHAARILEKLNIKVSWDTSQTPSLAILNMDEFLGGRIM